MGIAKNTGDHGEKLAAGFLVNEGYEILETNFRYQKAEIDLIASKGDTLVFVEVKTRKNNAFGYPEEFVDEKKAEMVLSAAEFYIYENDWTGDIRFDVISILLDNDSHEIMHFKDSFY